MCKSCLNWVWSNRTREMAQWVTYLLYKNEEMRLNLQNPHQPGHGSTQLPCTLTEKWESEPRECTAQCAEQWTVWEVKTDIQVCPQTSTHRIWNIWLHAHTSLYTHTLTHTHKRTHTWKILNLHLLILSISRINFVKILLFPMLCIEPRTPHILGRHSTTKLHHYAFKQFLKHPLILVTWNLFRISDY